jgi:hypothetical protein
MRSTRLRSLERDDGLDAAFDAADDAPVYRKRRRQKHTARLRKLRGTPAEGELFIDGGAVKAVRDGKSLFPAGVLRVSGTFGSKAVVRLLTDDGHAVALCRTLYSSSALLQLASRRLRSDEAAVVVGEEGKYVARSLDILIDFGDEVASPRSPPVAVAAATASSPTHRDRDRRRNKAAGRGVAVSGVSTAVAASSSNVSSPMDSDAAPVAVVVTSLPPRAVTSTVASTAAYTPSAPAAVLRQHSTSTATSAVTPSSGEEVRLCVRGCSCSCS